MKKNATSLCFTYMHRSTITSKLPCYQTKLSLASLSNLATILAISFMISRCYNLSSDWTTIPNNTTWVFNCITGVLDIIFVVVWLDINILFIFQETCGFGSFDVILLNRLNGYFVTFRHVTLQWQKNERSILLTKDMGAISPDTAVKWYIIYNITSYAFAKKSRHVLTCTKYSTYHLQLRWKEK